MQFDWHTVSDIYWLAGAKPIPHDFSTEIYNKRKKRHHRLSRRPRFVCSYLRDRICTCVIDVIAWPWPCHYQQARCSMTVVNRPIESQPRSLSAFSLRSAHIGKTRSDPTGRKRQLVHIVCLRSVLSGQHIQGLKATSKFRLSWPSSSQNRELSS